MAIRVAWAINDTLIAQIKAADSDVETESRPIQNMLSRRAVELGLPLSWHGRGERGLLMLLLADPALTEIKLTERGKALLAQMSGASR